VTTLGKYRELRHGAVVLPDNGGYNLAAGEMNPMIVMKFADKLTSHGAQAVFEPFANPNGKSVSLFEEVGIYLWGHSLESDHPRIGEADSTIDEPVGEFEGVLFHPPYFGSQPFTNDPRDLSRMRDVDEWLVAMESAAEIAVEHLVQDGVVCAVGRRYRHGGKEIRLDEWIVTAFSGLTPIEVWMSEPDVAIILRSLV